MSNFHENGNNSESFLRAVRPVIIATSDCSTVTRASGVPCLCSHPVCVGWFPCALKVIILLNSSLFCSKYNFFFNALTSTVGTKEIPAEPLRRTDVVFIHARVVETIFFPSTIVLIVYRLLYIE